MVEALGFKKATVFQGTVRPPSDKSLTHRAYLFAALATGSNGAKSVIRNPLRGEDCEGTLRCLGQLGAVSNWVDSTTVEIEAGHGLSGKGVTLDCGNSGTTMRLLSGVFASIDGLEVVLDGDASLRRRPMGRIVDPLRLMGADIPDASVPLHIKGCQLNGIDYQSPVASAQVKSCVLLAGLRANGRTSVTEPALSRDHTERMLTGLGVGLEREGLSVGLEPGQTWGSFEFAVPGDISSAAFWLVAASLIPGSDILLEEVGINPTRTGVIDVLGQAGVRVGILDERESLGEPVADLRVVAPGTLEAFEISSDLVPRLIDEIPVLAVMATQAEGTSVIRDAKELRVKETDRITTVADGLRAMGANVEVFEDGMSITGPTPLHGAEIDAEGDHRIGMSFAIAGSIAQGKTTVLNADSIRTSYPDFMKDYQTLAHF